jgi:biotin transport system substrate-specific component
MLDVRAATPVRLRAIQIALVIAGSGLMALGAHVSIPVPWSPVPITGQTFALALVVALLGTRGAVAALIVYLAEGALGLPVLSPHGEPAALRFIGPTGGYLIAFPLAAFVTGWLFDRGLWKSYLGRVVAIAAGTAVVFAGGASWLAHFVGVGPAFALGVAPFLIGDVLKTLAAAAAAPWVRRGNITATGDR